MELEISKERIQELKIEVNGLRRQQQNLIRQFDRKEIEEGTFQRALKILDDKIDKINSVILQWQYEHQQARDAIDKAQKIKETEEQIKMAEAKGKRENSNAQLILKALQLKEVKNYEDVAAKVTQWKPEADEKKVKAQAKTMVREIKAGKGAKAKKYLWSEENFTLRLS